MSGADITIERERWLERSRAAWNERAPDWDKMNEERREERAQDLKRALAALGARPGLRLLDAGCGSGQWAVGFARHGCAVTAIDLAPAMLERARAHAEDADARIEFREGDLASLPDPDGSYDIVHCRCVLQFSPDPAAVLREFARVLRPGGRLFAAVPGALSPIYAESYKRFLDPGTFSNRMLPWELERLLTDLGWAVHDGWGGYGLAGSGEAPVVSAQEAERLPPRLQQAAATIWSMVASAAP